MATDMTVATTILAQLGGRRFQMITGAKNFVGDADRLNFALPGKPGYVKNSISHVSIILTPADTYTVVFRRVRGRTVTVVSEHTDIYNDNLRTVFERETGLVTSLGTLGRTR
jgi:hypothetical protein